RRAGSRWRACGGLERKDSTARVGQETAALQDFDPAYVGFAGGCASRACIDDQMKTGHRSSHVERVLRQLIMIMNRERGALSSSSSPYLPIRGKSQVALKNHRSH